MKTPSTERLIDVAYSHGVQVRWHRSGPKGAFRCGPPPTITIRYGMTDAETVSALAHEIGHAAHGDRCGLDPAAERRAWRHAARLLVDPDDYRRAEEEVGCHPALLAHELAVTTEVIRTWWEIHSDLRSQCNERP